MEYNEKNIELLLPRYCEGPATVEEQRLVKDWMKESEENRRIVKQMEMLYLAADTIHVINKVHTEKALVKVKGKKTERRKVAWWEWAQRVACLLYTSYCDSETGYCCRSCGMVVCQGILGCRCA